MAGHGWLRQLVLRNNGRDPGPASLERQTRNLDFVLNLNDGFFKGEIEGGDQLGDHSDHLQDRDMCVLVQNGNSEVGTRWGYVWEVDLQELLRMTVGDSGTAHSIALGDLGSRWHPSHNEEDWGRQRFGVG